MIDSDNGSAVTLGATDVKTDGIVTHVWTLGELEKTRRQQDFNEWRIRQHLVLEAAEIGPRGISQQPQAPEIYLCPPKRKKEVFE